MLRLLYRLLLLNFSSCFSVSPIPTWLIPWSGGRGGANQMEKGVVRAPKYSSEQISDLFSVLKHVTQYAWLVDMSLGEYRSYSMLLQACIPELDTEEHAACQMTLL